MIFEYLIEYYTICSERGHRSGQCKTGAGSGVEERPEGKHLQKGELRALPISVKLPGQA